MFLGCGAVSEAKRAGEREKEGRKEEGRENRSSSPDSRRRRFTSARRVVSWDILMRGVFFSFFGGCELGMMVMVIYGPVW